MLENIIPQIVNDLLPDDIGMLDLISQADGRIQGGKQCQPTVKGNASHILRRNAFIHDLHEKLWDQHRRGGGAEHQYRHGEKPFPVGL